MSQEKRDFCAAYLRTMDPERAAEDCGSGDGFALLRRKKSGHGWRK